MSVTPDAIVNDDSSVKQKQTNKHKNNKNKKNTKDTNPSESLEKIRT